MKYEDFLVSSLGSGNVITPLKHGQRADSPVYKFVRDDERILYDVSLEYFKKCKETGEIPVSFEKAGPKESIFFEPAKTKVGIVTCSGEELAEGTVTRLAALKVLEQLRPADTVTICLPLFLAGGEGDRAFAK